MAESGDHVWPGWRQVDCGCCAGLEWGGEEPRECRRCKGWGGLFLHEKSRVLALWPGGPLAGMAYDGEFDPKHDARLAQ